MYKILVKFQMFELLMRQYFISHAEFKAWLQAV